MLIQCFYNIKINRPLYLLGQHIFVLILKIKNQNKMVERLINIAILPLFGIFKLVKFGNL